MAFVVKYSHMKKIVWFLAFFFIIVALFYGSRFIYRANTGQLVTNKGDVEISNWREFVSPSGDFKVLFAVEPRHINSDYQNVKRDAYRITNKDISYAVLVATYPFEKTSPFSLDKAKEMLEANLEANLLPGQTISSKNITNFGDYPAMDYVTKTTVDGTQFVYERGKVILVDSEKDFTLYFLSALYKDNLDDKSYNTFVNSFKILK